MNKRRLQYLLIGSIFLFPIILPSFVHFSNERIGAVENVVVDESIEEDFQEEIPTLFSFLYLHTNSTAGEVFSLSFASNQEENEVILSLPREASVVKEKLSPDISVEELEENQWLIHSDKKQKAFMVPLVIEEIGTYVASIGYEKTTLEITAPEENLEEEGPDVPSEEASPLFSFTGETKGRVNEPFSLTFVSTSEVEEATIYLPRELSIVTENLPVGISMEEIAEENYWVLKSEEPRTTFTLPLVVEEEGTYEVSVNDTEISIEIEASEEEPIEEELEKETEQEEVPEVEAEEVEMLELNEQEVDGSPRINSFTGMTVLNQAGQTISGKPLSSVGEFITIHGFPLVNASPQIYRNVGSYQGYLVDLHLSGDISLNIVNALSYPPRIDKSVSFTAYYAGTQTKIDAPLLLPMTVTGASLQVDSSNTGNGITSFNLEDLYYFGVVRGNVPYYSANLRPKMHSFFRAGGYNATAVIKNGSNINFRNTSINTTNISWTFRRNVVLPSFSVELIASPTDGGNPSIGSGNPINLIPGETTILNANPNTANNYRFVRWEVSGTGSSVGNLTEPQTLFVMGESNSVVTAIYEKVTIFPVDPLNPETEVDPENKPEIPEDQGLLSIDFVSQFDFGSKGISVQDQTYYAQPQRLLNEDGTVISEEERPNYVQISDRRPENERMGWQLSITQNGQFSGQNNQELIGARIRLANQKVVNSQGNIAPSIQMTEPLELVPGLKSTLLTAKNNEGYGTWIYRFGDKNTSGESVSLDIPKGTNPEATSYSTTFIWELSVVPENE